MVSVRVERRFARRRRDGRRGRHRDVAREAPQEVVRGTRLGLGRATAHRARVGARERGSLRDARAAPSPASAHPRDVSAGVKRRRRERLARGRAWGRTLHAHGVYRRQVYVSRLAKLVKQRRLALQLLLPRNRRGDSLQLRGERRHGGRLARSESHEALSVRSRGACLDPTPSRGRSVPATVVHRSDACGWNARLACGEPPANEPARRERTVRRKKKAGDAAFLGWFSGPVE